MIKTWHGLLENYIYDRGVVLCSVRFCGFFRDEECAHFGIMRNEVLEHTSKFLTFLNKRVNEKIKMSNVVGANMAIFVFCKSSR